MKLIDQLKAIPGLELVETRRRTNEQGEDPVIDYVFEHKTDADVISLTLTVGTFDA